MSIYRDALQSNARYAEQFSLGHLPIPPAKKLAVVACMDARLMVEPILGLSTGDAHIIRNAGGLVTDDALRSLIISHHLLGTNTVFIIEHTECGMLTFRDEELQRRLSEGTGQDASGIAFLAFSDLEDNVREQARKIRRNPFLPDHLEVHGFIYDVKTGRLNEVRVEKEVSRHG
jgi:carbonic anhydrase